MATKLTHPQVWGAIDRLAARYGFSASGLAKAAGLDPTSFNRSKRVTPEGRPRWPSTESVAKILQATGAGIDEFVSLLSQKKKGRGPVKPLPMIDLSEASSSGYFDGRGFPAGPGWDMIPFPGLDDEHAYALGISTSTLAPLYRKGEIVVVSPAAPLRKGDRVVAKARSGEIFAAELKRKSARSVDFVSLAPGHRDRSLPANYILWIARIVWSSQ